MRAMILAAGSGDRMRPLTDNCPKPLLEVGGKPLIVWHLENLQRAGVEDVVINTSHHAAQLHNALGDGGQYGLRIRFSDEQPLALETLGGILRALPLLDEQPFMLINGDVWTDFPLFELRRLKVAQAHLLLVDNPAHHPHGDFCLRNGHAHYPNSDAAALTYAGIGVFHPDFFAGQADTNQPVPLAPLLFAKANRGEVTAQHLRHQWVDVGTPERLQALDTQLQAA